MLRKKERQACKKDLIYMHKQHTCHVFFKVYRRASSEYLHTFKNQIKKLRRPLRNQKLRKGNVDKTYKEVVRLNALGKLPDDNQTKRRRLDEREIRNHRFRSPKRWNPEPFYMVCPLRAIPYKRNMTS